MIPHIYKVKVVWNESRKGYLCSPDIDNHPLESQRCIEIATPPEFPKGIPGIWSPEHLFTASVASCLMTTFLAIADNSKLEFTSFECEAEGKLEQVEGKFRMTEVLLKPVVGLLAEKDRERAMKVLEKSEQHCLITHSVNSRVLLHPEVIVGVGA